MCKGISILKARIRAELFEEYALAERVRQRGESDQHELWFMYPDPVVQLPVERGGEIEVLEWGNRPGKKVSKLPATGWCRKESLEEGRWRWLRPEPVVIAADFGLEKGAWFPIDQGIRGVVVDDEQGRPHVYMLTQAASHYYQIMTRHDRMPVLVDQEI